MVVAPFLVQNRTVLLDSCGVAQAFAAARFCLDGTNARQETPPSAVSRMPLDAAMACGCRSAARPRAAKRAPAPTMPSTDRILARIFLPTPGGRAAPGQDWRRR